MPSDRDHPRGCGENTVSTLQHRQFIGITPADAGKTINQPEAGCLTEDHPRGCGENGGQKKLRPIFKGSPPRMRGKRPTKFLRCGNLRITPADAGKTDFGLSYFVSFQDHPRGCGENRFLYMRRSLYRGSPPRMRGKHRAGFLWGAAPRITPADAGKTRVRNAFTR